MAHDMADDDQHQYAERMFPEPVDLGIAQPDRAVSSVTHGTQSFLEGEGGERGSSWYHGGVARPRTRPCRASPSIRRRTACRPRAIPFEPVKIGILIDMDLNQLLADWIDPTILAIEDALNEGVWTVARSQLVIADVVACPGRTTAR